MDTSLNAAGIEVGRKCVAPLGSHDKQMVNLPRPVLAYRKGQPGNPLQMVEVVIGDRDAMLGPAIKVAQLGAEDRRLQSIKPRAAAFEFVIILGDAPVIGDHAHS